jgi:predicted phosphodiesterase
MPTIALIADIHANTDALDAVLKDAGDESVPVWCMGDMVGRGGDPTWTLRTLRARYERTGDVKVPFVWLGGNHDYLVCLSDEEAASDQVAWENAEDIQRIARWTHHRLLENAQDELEWLRAVGSQPFQLIEAERIAAVHALFILDRQNGRIDQNDAWNAYPRDDERTICNQRQVIESCYNWIPRIILNGHTHLAHCWLYRPGEGVIKKHPLEHAVICRFEISDTDTLFLNPGSVGFPRGKRHCPSYMLLHSEQADFKTVSIEYREVRYDPLKMTQCLPETLPESILAPIRKALSACSTV